MACIISRKKRVKKEHYLIDKTIQYNVFIKIYFSNIGNDKSNKQKQISKLLILFAMTA